jgi:hypothetical protein
MTSILDLPVMEAALAQKELTFNAAMQTINARVRVLSRSADVPPIDAGDGDAYIVPADATGIWSTHVDEVAIWFNDGWLYYTPAEGPLIYVIDESLRVEYITGSPSGWDVAGSLATTSDAVVNDSAVDGATVSDALEELQSKIDGLSASTVDYTPVDASDWDSSTDPGNVDDALDQLAARTKALEGGGSGGSAGRHSIPIMAGAMTPSVVSGCAALATIASASNQPDIQTLNFDASAIEYAQFAIPMPKSWNEGTVTFVPIWSHAATTTNFDVIWGLQAVAVSNDDPIPAAYGTAQSSTDTGGTTDDLYRGPESSAITVAGTPAAEDVVFFRIYRNATDGADTLAIDARLHGIVLYITTDAENDA